MNIEWLETFVILVESGNFTKTAEQQFLTQSTVSKRISELEKLVGKDLFLRDNKNVKLTRSGEAFLPYAKRILMLKKDSIIKARAVGMYEDRLALGMTDSIYKGEISNILKKYYVSFPSVAIKLKVNHSEEIIRLVSDGILDIGFVYTKSKCSKFQVIDFKDEEMILVTTPKDGMKIEEELQCSDLINLPLIYTDLGEEFFIWISNIFGDSPLFKLSADEDFYAVDFVKEGFGYAFVAKSSVKNDLVDGKLVHVKIKDMCPPRRKIYMIINKSKKESMAIKSWLEMIGYL